jgi:hypothetical protein
MADGFLIQPIEVGDDHTLCWHKPIFDEVGVFQGEGVTKTVEVSGAIAGGVTEDVITVWDLLEDNALAQFGVLCYNTYTFVYDLVDVSSITSFTITLVDNFDQSESVALDLDIDPGDVGDQGTVPVDTSGLGPCGGYIKLETLGGEGNISVVLDAVSM